MAKPYFRGDYYKIMLLVLYSSHLRIARCWLIAYKLTMHWGHCLILAQFYHCV